MLSAAKKIRLILLGPPLIATLILSGCFKGSEKKVKKEKIEKTEKIEETKKEPKTTKKHDFED